jgi:hypothetical protein
MPRAFAVKCNGIALLDSLNLIRGCDRALGREGRTFLRIVAIRQS